MRRARWKRKNVRRVGLRRRRPPAAGGGWLAVPCRSQGRKRPALGETSGPGKNRDTLSLPPRCRLRSREEQPAAAKIDAGPCVNHPDEVGTIRHGAAVPTSQKSIACPKAGPNRGRHRYADPRAHGGPLHRSAPSAFLFGPCTARFSFGKTKEKWGVHPGWTSPPGGSQSPEAAVRRPIYPQAVDNRPYGVYRVRIFPNPCNESPAKRTYLTERRENPHGRYGTDLSGPCQDRL